MDDRFLGSAPGVYRSLGIAGIILWDLIDELTKPMLHNGRHFSWIDVGYNVIGVVIGAVVWIVISCGL